VLTVNHSTLDNTGMDARSIIERLRAAGHRAYLVGGAVRDTLLGLAPSEDDIATSARPEVVLDLFPGARFVGAHFGVVLVDGVEVATFRSEDSYLDGRHPSEVRFETDPRQDAARRDFTINALFLDPLSGELLDFTGGRDDLAAGIIRAIGDPAARFGEDHLRMLRAVRFAARLDFAIEPATLSAIERLAPRVVSISPERIRQELTKMFTGPRADRALVLLDQCRLLEHVLPELKAMQGVEQPPEFHPEGDVWVHTLKLASLLRSPSPTLAWGALLHDAGKPGTFERLDRIRFNGHVELGVTLANGICQRLRFSDADREQIVALVKNHMRFGDIHRMKESTLKRFLRLDRFEEHLELHRVDCLASHGLLDNYWYAKERFESLPEEELRPVRLLTGGDLISAGWVPGPEFRRVLEAVEDAQLDGRIATRDQALELAATLRSPRAG
jgi:putative nucleotidyltransferase with HDIG domain